MSYIGEIRKALTPYYDRTTGQKKIKSRPALVIAQADAADYVVLPISSITFRNNLNPEYDIEVDPAQYPLLHLTKQSFIRTHKQTVIHAAEIGDIIGDLKNNYPELYLETLEKREKFSEEITRQAL